LVNKEICLHALDSEKTLNRLVCLCSALAGRVARRPHLCCRGSLTAILSSRLRDISPFILPRKFSSLLCSSKYVPEMLTLIFLLFRLWFVLQAQPLLLVNAPMPYVAFLGLDRRVRFLSSVMCSVWDWGGLKMCWRAYCFAHRFLSLATLAKMGFGFWVYSTKCTLPSLRSFFWQQGFGFWTHFLRDRPMTSRCISSSPAWHFSLCHLKNSKVLTINTLRWIVAMLESTKAVYVVPCVSLSYWLACRSLTDFGAWQVT